jgi:hypothetical protein
MSIEFYDVKLREKVQIPKDRVRKVTFNTKNGQVRYGLRGYTDDDRKLTKFVSKANWDELDVPQED